ncbi:hypothetical protein PHAVU_008G228500 [Phaseolus vulgaris]|uniref:Neprosin PEP catalytic domain-containing protein n=1 Tax=Phaseolus vulgaris TaxID=3885 RepID=V7B8B5_PHAVU|nr:hypothetical protein PHAVU_008G228500g [Phaseolus vulgaris]ESW13815.1 hypothetical protein PHAVU_008G228500g [Phaseolus vulgaris]
MAINNGALAEMKFPVSYLETLPKWLIYGIENVLKEDLELERQLKLINKSPIKTINTEYGNVVDCIDINKQPAFDHPLLQNHKLHFKIINSRTRVKNLSNGPIFGLRKDQCPKGTVPIPRTTKEDLIREKKLLNSSIFLRDIPGVHLAEVALSSKFGPYYSVSGTNSVYNPTVTKGQMSLSHIWVQNGPIDTNNKISIGWHDPLTKNWWIGGDGYYMGYFPSKLFSNMGSADKVGLGGRTLTPRGSPSPPMGSGHFPDKNFFHASFYRYIFVENATRRNYGPEKYQIENYFDKPNCFRVNYYGNLQRDLGYSLQFGGPGGNCDN